MVIKNKSAFRSQSWMELLIALIFPKELWVWPVRRRGTPHSLSGDPAVQRLRERRKWAPVMPFRALILSCDTCGELETGNSEPGRQPETFRKRAKPFRNTALSTEHSLLTVRRLCLSSQMTEP